MNTAELRHGTCSYLDSDPTSQAPVMVLLHGFPLNSRMWRHQVSAFSESHRVLVPDLRGHGGSTVTHGTVTMAQMANDVAELLDQLEIIEPICLGGLSMGGYVAWEFWLQNASRLKQLMLFDTRAQNDTEQVARGRHMMAAQVVREGAEMAADAMVPKLVARTTKDWTPELVDEVRRMILETDPEAIAATQRGMAERVDMTDRLGQIDVPALVLCGENDSISPPEEMQQFAEALPNGQFALIPKAGHLAPLEQPEAVNSAMGDFFASTQ